MRVAVLTCRTLPSFVTWEIPDVDELFADDRALIVEFGKRQIAAETIVWSDQGVDWDGFDVALIRSTWDYIDEHDQFLSALPPDRGFVVPAGQSAQRRSLEHRQVVPRRSPALAGAVVPTWRASVELVEPMLYFEFAPEAAGRLADAVQGGRSAG
jgi:hypothetical protein